MAEPAPPHIEPADALGALARRAAAGDGAALEELCRAVQDPIYRLALRMLSDPHDAEDCTQEIMIQVVTALAGFEGRSKFMTWVYTIASRHLLKTRKRLVESSVKGPDAFGQWLDEHREAVPYTGANEAETRLLCEEVRIGCTYGMLLCLSRELRLAYILGDLLELSDVEGAQALEITPAAFRQRLKRARDTIRPIIAHRCGLVDQRNPCRCALIVRPAIAHGIIPASGPVYMRHPTRAPPSRERVARAAEQLDAAERFAELFRDDPAFAAPPSIAAHLRQACPDLLG